MDCFRSVFILTRLCLIHDELSTSWRQSGAWIHFRRGKLKHHKQTKEYSTVLPHMDGSIVFSKWRQCAPLSNARFLGPTQVHIPNSISIGSAVFTARRSYASTVLRVVILSVRPSIHLSHEYFVTNPKHLLAIFLYHMEGQSFYFSEAKDLGEILTGSPPMGAK